MPSLSTSNPCGSEPTILKFPGTPSSMQLKSVFSVVFKQGSNEGGYSEDTQAPWADSDIGSLSEAQVITMTQYL